MRSITAAAAIAILFAGCGTQSHLTQAESVPPADSVLTVPPPRPSTTAEPATARATTPSSEEITLSFVGDIHFEDEIRPRLTRPDTALETISSTLSKADVTVANLETAITERGTAEPKTYTFRAAPAALDALAAGGIDVATMANNHAVDYGAAGLRDTLSAIEVSPIPVVGVGRDADGAFAPAIVNVRGTQVAVLGATQVPEHTARTWAAGPDRAGVAVVARSPDRLLTAVRRASREADLVVVYLHYGQERVSCPTSEQRRIVRQLTDAGADIVVGSHAHILLGAGWSGQSYVSYGLGNFVWYSPNSRREATTGVLTLTVRNGHVVEDEFTPAYIRQDGLPRVISTDQRRLAEDRWRGLRECADLAARPE